MIICICRNLNEQQIKEKLKEDKDFIRSYKNSKCKICIPFIQKIKTLDK